MNEPGFLALGLTAVAVLALVGTSVVYARRIVGESDGTVPASEPTREVTFGIVEIRPARRVHDRIVDLWQEEATDDHAGDDGERTDELGVVARAYVGVHLSDAVESLFEHEPLRKRLNRGVY